jgi:hypothetical protein
VEVVSGPGSRIASGPVGHVGALAGVAGVFGAVGVRALAAGVPRVRLDGLLVEGRGRGVVGERKCVLTMCWRRRTSVAERGRCVELRAQLSKHVPLRWNDRHKGTSPPVSGSVVVGACTRRSISFCPELVRAASQVGLGLGLFIRVRSCPAVRGVVL